MDLIDQLRAISNRIPKMRDHLKTEEATKTALIMPFIQFKNIAKAKILPTTPASKPTDLLI